MKTYVGTIGETQFTPLQIHRIKWAIGRIMPAVDKGKRVYDCGNGVYQVESSEQRDKRQGREVSKRGE